MTEFNTALKDGYTLIIKTCDIIGINVLKDNHEFKSIQEIADEITKKFEEEEKQMKG